MMMNDGTKAQKIKYLNRLVGKGSSGCRHKSFTAEPAIVAEEIFNPSYHFKGVENNISMKVFTKERPRDVTNPNVEKDRCQKDNRFEHGLFYGDASWFFEMYLNYLIVSKDLGDKDLVFRKYGEPRVVPDMVLRKNFILFWEHFSVQVWP